MSTSTPADGPRPPITWKGISGTTLLEAGVTVTAGTIRVPYRWPDGTEFRAKLFRPGRSWWEPADATGVLPLGLETLPTATVAARSVLIVCEGESDTLAVRDTLAVLDDRLVYPIGLPGASTWREEWKRWLRPFPTIYAFGDGDDAGRRMNATIMTDVPWSGRSRPRTGWTPAASCRSTAPTSCSSC
jgi:hypothetical protein